MRKSVLVILFVACSLELGAQTRSELENLRKKNLEEIEYVDRLLKSTANAKKENLGVS